MVSVFLIYHKINGTIIKHRVDAYIFPIAGSILVLRLFRSLSRTLHLVASFISASSVLRNFLNLYISSKYVNFTMVVLNYPLN